MRNCSLLLGLILMLSFCACGRVRDFTPEENQLLDQTVANLEQAFFQLDTSSQMALQELQQVEPFSTEARPILQKLVDSQNFIHAAGIFNKEGILKIAEPAEFKVMEGLDLSQTPKVQDITKHWHSLMSDLFADQKGNHAFEVLYPLYDNQNQPLGFVSVYINHIDFISLCIMPNLDMTGINIGVMQTDGVLLYEENWQEIGLNLFTAPIYQPFEELRELGKTIVSLAEGEGRYRFYDETMQLAQSKKAKWKTVTYLNKAWRVIMNTER